MSVNDLVLVQGMAHTRAALRRFNDRPFQTLRPWLALSLAIAVLILTAVYVIARASTPDLTFAPLPGITQAATGADYAHILYRNALVLALHAMACVAGFMAGSSVPLAATHLNGLNRWVHEKAGPLAIAFVTAATLFSLSTQAYAIGAIASSTAAQLHVSVGTLMLSILPHAVPELTALFLPLAAWIIASRRGQWDQLLAATVITIGLAVPVLLASAAVELWVSPDLLRAMAGV